MKKLILSLALLLTVSMSAFAQFFNYKDIEYKILSEADKTVEVYSGKSFNGSELIIPDKVTGWEWEYTVTAIEESAFFNNTPVTSVSIPATVKNIGNNAFQSCSNLTSLTFEGESQLEQIGDGAFYNTVLTTIKIPATVKTIGNKVFQYCDNLTSLTFEGESQLEQIGYGAFNSTVLKTIDIPASVTSIGAFAFGENTALLQVYMHRDNPSGYSFDAFRNCPNAVIYAPAASYETYKSNFAKNKVEVELTEWKTYAENKIEEGLNALNTLSDEGRKYVNECLSNISTAVTFDAAYAAFKNAMPIINA
ncbi:MAG: leucine-rich repeat domain-containing protein, partial [Bacteroidales bacterium]|nr:leucine-rich repeat domain-containing protein [Candidatus Sodaliphilus aphodohippi]